MHSYIFLCLFHTSLSFESSEQYVNWLSKKKKDVFAQFLLFWIYINSFNRLYMLM